MRWVCGCGRPEFTLAFVEVKVKEVRGGDHVLGVCSLCLCVALSTYVAELAISNHCCCLLVHS